VLTLDGDRLCQLDDVARGYADRNELPGLVWAVARGEQAHGRFAGHLDLEAGVPLPLRPLTPSSSSRVSALITSSFRLVVFRRRCDGCGRDNPSLESVGMADPVTDPVAEHDARSGEDGAGPPEWAHVRDR
jgi:hypothetical protein